MEIFEINPGLFIWSLITFLMLVGLLYKFAFNPLMRHAEGAAGPDPPGHPRR